MMTMCVLTEATFSYGSLRPSNMAKDGGFKSSGKYTPIYRLRVVGGPTVPSPLGDWTLVGVV